MTSHTLPHTPMHSLDLPLFLLAPQNLLQPLIDPPQLSPNTTLPYPFYLTQPVSPVTHMERVSFPTYIIIKIT